MPLRARGLHKLDTAHGKMSNESCLTSVPRAFNGAPLVQRGYSDNRGVMMVHRQEPNAELTSDIQHGPYRVRAHMRTSSPEFPIVINSVGLDLRGGRERTGKHIYDVGRALRINPNYIAAIEEGRFGDLPGRAFTIGYVGRYARYLHLDAVDLQQRLATEIAAYNRSHHRIDVERPIGVSHHVEAEPLSDRKFPVLSIAIVSLLALLAYWSAGIGFATRDLQLVTKDVAQNAANAAVHSSIEQQRTIGEPELLRPTPQIVVTSSVAVRPETRSPIPQVAVTRTVSLRPELLPQIPRVAVTRAASLRPELLPQIPRVAVAPAVSLRPELLPQIPTVAVTQAVPLPHKLLPAIPQIAVSALIELRTELLPPIPEIAVTPVASLRPELLPPSPQIAITRAVAPRAGSEAQTSQITAPRPLVSVAPDLGDDFQTDERAIIRGYMLTVPKFRAFIDGVRALAAAKRTDDSLARELDVIDSDPPETLANLQEQLAAHPRIFAFYQDRGLTAGDTILIPLVAGYAAAALADNNPILFTDRINRVQLNFVLMNYALVDRLMAAYAALSFARSPRPGARF